jgi:gliding motility-associated-like protein
MCFPDTLILQTVHGTSYLWQDGSTDSTFLVNQPGTFFVDITLTNCHIFDTVNVDQEILHVDLLPDTAWYCIGEDVEVTAYLDNAVYHWSTGSTQQFEIFSTNLIVTLIASQGGCTAFDTMEVTEFVCHCPFFVPNSFTPNNDGKNEIFKPAICSELNFYTMTIFNRWGQEIWRTNDPAKGWDGKHGSTDAPQGVYSYVINYDSYAYYADEITVTGHVNLIR